MFAKIPYPHSCEHMHCEHRQDGICILQNTRDNRGKIIGCDRGETRLMYENGKIPITNADSIRSMSDEELARQNVRKRRGYCVWTTSDGREFTSYLGFGGGYRADEDTIALAVQHELDWLQQPAETEGTE